MSVPPLEWSYEDPKIAIFDILKCTKNGKVDNLGSMLPKICIILKISSNKSFSELNFVQKSQGACTFISLRIMMY